MVIFKKINDIQQFIADKRAGGASIGFIPTMGALHNGHISLVAQARKKGDFTVCSIFLNPTQFNNPEDLSKYPVSTDADILLLINAGCDVLFLPDTEEMYPGGSENIASYDFGALETILEGAKRPGHFKGVGQIVGRLLEIVRPDIMYLGQKDYQQVMIITRLKDLMPKTADGFNPATIRIERCPTMREPDGLAMSSRNRRLTEPQRTLAGVLYQCLVSIQAKQYNTSFSVVCKECEDILTAKGFVIDYIALADARNLDLLDNYSRNVPMVALIAASIGKIRLIDNLLLA